MNNSNTMNALFEPKPTQWSLRGDPFLWEAMKSNFTATPMPNNAESLAKLIRQQFKEITSHSLDEDKYFKLHQFNHGGMSGGGISPEFWRNTLIPLLQQRLLGFSKHD